jgi:hypothetical protein
MQDILNIKMNYKISQLFDEELKEDIIVYTSNIGGGTRYEIFKQLRFTINVKKICNEKYNLLKKPYLCIQVRNTDYKSDYELLYNNNKEEIHSFNEIYLATDDKKVIEFYKSKGLLIQNFTTFPKANRYHNLHNNYSIDNHTKIIDLFCDIYIGSMSEKILSNSLGGFKQLLLACNENKQDTFNQFQ